MPLPAQQHLQLVRQPCNLFSLLATRSPVLPPLAPFPGRPFASTCDSGKGKSPIWSRAGKLQTCQSLSSLTTFLLNTCGASRGHRVPMTGKGEMLALSASINNMSTKCISATGYQRPSLSVIACTRRQSMLERQKPIDFQTNPSTLHLAPCLHLSALRDPSATLASCPVASDQLGRRSLSQMG